MCQLLPLRQRRFCSRTWVSVCITSFKELPTVGNFPTQRNLDGFLICYTYLNTVKVFCQIKKPILGSFHASNLKVGTLVILESVGDELLAVVGLVVVASHAQVVRIQHRHD